MLFALAAGLLTSAFFAGIGEDIGVLAIVSSVLAIPLIGFLIFLNTTTSSLATSGPSRFLLNQFFCLTLLPMLAFILYFIMMRAVDYLSWIGPGLLFLAFSGILGCGIFFFLGFVCPIALMLGVSPTFPASTTVASTFITAIVGSAMLYAVRRFWIKFVA